MVIGWCPGHVQPGRQCPASPCPGQKRRGGLPSPLPLAPCWGPLCPPLFAPRPTLLTQDQTPRGPPWDGRSAKNPAKTHREASLAAAAKIPREPAWVGAGQGGGRGRGGREIPPQPHSGTSVSPLRGNHRLPRRGWEADGGTGRKTCGMVLRCRCSQTHLAGCHVTPGPSTPPGFPGAEEEAPAHPAGRRRAAFTSLGATSPPPPPSLADTHPCREKKNQPSSRPLQDKRPFVSGRKHLPPLQPHARNPRAAQLQGTSLLPLTRR